jgi:hypothetical protein
MIGSEVLKAVVMGSYVFWDITSCRVQRHGRITSAQGTELRFRCQW